MKIKMLVAIAGPGFSLQPGEVTDRFENVEAIRLIERGYAEPIMSREIETTMLEPVAERRRGHRRLD